MVKKLQCLKTLQKHYLGHAEHHANKYRGGTSDATTSSSLIVPLLRKSIDDFLPPSPPQNSHIRRSEITGDGRWYNFSHFPLRSNDSPPETQILAGGTVLTDRTCTHLTCTLRSCTHRPYMPTHTLTHAVLAHLQNTIADIPP